MVFAIRKGVRNCLWVTCTEKVEKNRVVGKLGGVGRDYDFDIRRSPEVAEKDFWKGKRNEVV